MQRRNQPAVSGQTHKLNRKIQSIARSTEVKNIKTVPGLNEILKEAPIREKIQGYYVQIPLSDYETFVPKVQQFPDRYDKQYDNGQFDAPLFTLEEWRKKWSSVNLNEHTPDLLVNANWFNVWNTGIPNQGVKINPRTQDRTYLIGLSLSNGELISSHNVLDQEDVGLDTIVIDTVEKKAEIIEHHQIDERSGHPGFYKNKNAVSGFIIMKDNQNVKTPNLNNNHNNRLPRTGLGYHNDGKNMVLIVIHNTDRSIGVTAEEFADLFRALGCDNAINLDNSGSVELFYKGLGEFGMQEVKVNTKTCDAGANSERPKPNFIGFKNVAKTRFFSADDSDLSSTKQATVPVNRASKSDDVVNYHYKRN